VALVSRAGGPGAHAGRMRARCGFGHHRAGRVFRGGRGSCAAACGRSAGRNGKPPPPSGTTCGYAVSPSVTPVNGRVAAKDTGGLRAPGPPARETSASACRPSPRPGSVLIQRLDEPPDAGPHVRWCGRGRGDPGPYPITATTHKGFAPTRKDGREVATSGELAGQARCVLSPRSRCRPGRPKAAISWAGRVCGEARELDYSCWARNYPSWAKIFRVGHL